MKNKAGFKKSNNSSRGKLKIGDNWNTKRQLKKSGIQGIQNEFGIGLLSFWTVGDELTITSTGE